MKEIAETVVTWALGIILGTAVGSYIQKDAGEEHLLRDCSITGTHIIDDNTIVVCQVLKIRQQETPAPDGNTKPPEISL